MTEPSKVIGFVFIDRFADWEFGLLAASACFPTAVSTPRRMPIWMPWR